MKYFYLFQMLRDKDGNKIAGNFEIDISIWWPRNSVILLGQEIHWEKLHLGSGFLKIIFFIPDIFDFPVNDLFLMESERGNCGKTLKI